MELGDKDILVIEPDGERREAIERILVEEGFAPAVAAEGFTALRLAAERPFALAIAAVELPGTWNGPAVLRHLRQHQPWLKALYTGSATRRVRLADADREDFLAAPFPRRDLLGSVFELLQRGRADGDLRRLQRGLAG